MTVLDSSLFRRASPHLEARALRRRPPDGPFAACPRRRLWRHHPRSGHGRPHQGPGRAPPPRSSPRQPRTRHPRRPRRRCRRRRGGSGSAVILMGYSHASPFLTRKYAEPLGKQPEEDSTTPEQLTISNANPSRPAMTAAERTYKPISAL